MENLDLKLFGDCYRSRRVLVTGHTGFKGSWLALWLQRLGANLIGLALPPSTTPSHWDLLDLAFPEYRIDIRDVQALERAILETEPEIVLHLAAQPLVRRSYQDPLETWSTNVMGTANLLEACRKSQSLKAIVVVSSDKCYENQEWPWGYRETDRLGGHDPYSASKAAMELVVASYRCAFFQTGNAPLIATARAGNVIGGGDWSEDRLIPDLVRALSSQWPLRIRSPNATRPWQHVLESLSGYLLLGQKLLEGHQEFAQAWNFGPAPESNQTVGQVLIRLKNQWPEIEYQIVTEPQPHEAKLLYLDSAKSRIQLGWCPVWNFEKSLVVTRDWYSSYLEAGHVESSIQLEAYITEARLAQVSWTRA